MSFCVAVSGRFEPYDVHPPPLIRCDRCRTPVTRIPIMAKQVLDLYELYKLVVSHGGLVEVINKKLWREITKGLQLPQSITSAAFTLRTQQVGFCQYMDTGLSAYCEVDIRVEQLPPETVKNSGDNA
ncbi:unnamed protein product [Soboliphyme baturini]|uniref:ARID domain-containing protein n=1 Tax=Soboliphyme baturini TaxID=241478 RepID=A0A183IEC1_9BILA|nr:unnamed protein product [Soboliphyme baturini]